MDDMVSRQAAIDIADDLRDCISVDGYWAWTERLKKLPSAQPERTGRWIFKDDRRIEDGYDWRCDQCGSYQRYTSNYCPHCGARMEGENEND